LLPWKALYAVASQKLRLVPFEHSKTLSVLKCYCAFAAVLGSTTPTLEILSLHEK